MQASKSIPALHLDFPVPEFYREPYYRIGVTVLCVFAGIMHGLNLYDYFYRPASAATWIVAVGSAVTVGFCLFGLAAASVGPDRFRCRALDLDVTGILWTRGYVKAKQFPASTIQDIELDLSKLTLNLRSGKRQEILLDDLGWEKHQELQAWIDKYWSKVKRKSSKVRA